MDHKTAAKIKTIARQLGFDRAGICSAEPVGRQEYVRSWAVDRAGEMEYLRRNLEVRLDPRRLLEGARSVIVVAANYHQPEPGEQCGPGPTGRIASYAWGDDYHRVLRDKLRELVERLRAEVATPFAARVCVDTAPIVERELAARAGVGWIGKNTLVLDAELGSYFFLGEVVTTLELPADPPAGDHCGSCTRCLEACPTAAFPAPYEMDATRCISYLTIEHRGEIDAGLRPLIGDWVFGCDICQEVCPYNRQPPRTRVAEFAVRPPGPRVDLPELLSWGPAEYAATLRGSAIKRATLAMLQRNARIAVDNARSSREVSGAPLKG